VFSRKTCKYDVGHYFRKVTILKSAMKSDLKVRSGIGGGGGEGGRGGNVGGGVVTFSHESEGALNLRGRSARERETPESINPRLLSAVGGGGGKCPGKRHPA